MDITPLGLSSFKLRGKTAVVITDPFDPDIVGLKYPKTGANIVTISHNHPDHNYRQGIEGITPEEPPVFFEGPGEYEANGVEIMGIDSFHDEKNGAERGQNTIFKILMDNITLVHLGDLGHKLTEEQLALLENVDVLFVPVGGVYTLDPQTASSVVSEIEPSIVIPMHYKTAKLDQKLFGSLSDVSVFLKDMGKEEVLPEPKLKVTRDSLPEETKVVVLE